MSKINDGGPAFASAANGCWEGPGSDGMSLRDWFAGMAPPMAGSIEFRSLEFASESLGVPLPEDITDERKLFNFALKSDSAYRYMWADSMIAEREKEPKQ